MLVAATQRHYWVTFSPALPSPAGTRYTRVASLPIFVDRRWPSVGLQMLTLYALEALSWRFYLGRSTRITRGSLRDAIKGNRTGSGLRRRTMEHIATLRLTTHLILRCAECMSRTCRKQLLPVEFIGKIERTQTFDAGVGRDPLAGIGN